MCGLFIHVNQTIQEMKKVIYKKKNEFYLESGSHSSWVSRVDSSVSVDVAEWAWLGVDGRLVFNRRRHVHLRSDRNEDNNSKNLYHKHRDLPIAGAWPSQPLDQPLFCCWLPPKFCCWRASNLTVRQYVINITPSGI